MKIYIVAPYSAMEASLKLIESKYNYINISYGIGNLNDGLKLARNAEINGFDAIISRGGTARLIKKNINIPVIDMKLSGNDILKAILLADNGYKTAIVAYSNITTGAKEIIDLLGLKMQIYTISDDIDLTNLLIQLKKEKTEQILGDIVAVNKAKELLFKTILFQSSYETIKIATDYAIDLINQINNCDIMNIISHKFFENSNKDYCILKENKVIQAKFNNFTELPISIEKLIGLKYEYKDKLKNEEIFIDYSKKLQVSLSKISHENKNYYLYKFNKINKVEPYPKGVSIYKPNGLYKLVCNSNAMQKSIDRFSKLIKNKNLIVLNSDDEFTIENHLKYLYNIGNKASSILLIDSSSFEFPKLDSLDLKFIKNLVFTNVENIEQLTDIRWLSSNLSQKIFIIVKSSYWIQDEEMIANIIDLPNTQDRKDDIIGIFNHYINNCHNDIGSKPMKVNDNFLKGFDLIKNESIYNLINILNISIKASQELLLDFDEFYKHYRKMEEKKYKLIKDDLTLEEIELNVIKMYLEEEEYNQSKVAERLGISRATLRRKMKKYNL
ncbi:MAG: PrpR N-terminal domain-containing protein [Peptoniphilaceae bacterium]|nr:PrpR N-terminal domain-containing protein [Peptoniphilaceae bacterium]MDY6018974.1 PrpR N-terminal domain-containing protein [Anaerococcus sp.]